MTQSRYEMSPMLVVFALRSLASAPSRPPPHLRRTPRGISRAPGVGDEGLMSEGRRRRARMHAEFPVRSRWCVHTGWRLSTSSFKWRSSAVMALAEMPVSRSRRLCKRPGSFSERRRHSSPPNQQNPSKRLHFSRWDTQLVGDLLRMRSLS